MIPSDFEDRIQRSLDAKASPSFIVRLGEELQDRHGFQKKSRFRGLFRLVFASVLLVAILAISVTPPFGNEPLSAQAFLEESYETYETEATLSGVYYEKTFYSNPYKDPEGANETIHEEWSDSKGNRVYSEENPETGEPYFMRMILINEEGEEEFYRVPHESDPFAQGSYYCIYEENILKADAQDPSTVAIYQEDIFDPQEEEEVTPDELPLVPAPSEEEQAYNDLEKARTHSEEAKAILEELKSDPAIQYQVVEEKGEKYYLFVIPLYFNTDDDMYYYFSADTYRLHHVERYERSKGNGLSFRLDYLESRYMTEEEAEGIFDPKTYGAVLEETNPSQSPVPEGMDENGCYDNEGNRLTLEEEEGLWGRLDTRTQSTFNEMKTYEEIPVYEEGSDSNEPLELEDRSLEAYVEWISSPSNAQSIRSSRAPSSYEVNSAFDMSINYVYFLKNPTNFISLHQWKDPAGSLFYLQSTEVDLNCLPSEECMLMERWYGPFVGEAVDLF